MQLMILNGVRCLVVHSLSMIKLYNDMLYIGILYKYSLS